jgi:anti-sigma regulatory factor (Ser/Thr protein kinase)
MRPQSVFTIDDSSQIGGARRAAAELAASLEFDATQAGKIGIAVNEAGTNIVKHAGRGRLLLRALECDGTRGIEVLALDSGPGISDVAASLRDGHSTHGTMGSGLGALSRLSHDFQIFTQPGKGTALRMELWSKPLTNLAQAFEYGGLCLAYPGEPVSGDDWEARGHRDQLTVLLADGLGHGVDAHLASRAATDVLRARPQDEALALIDACHGALARTRGAAVAVAKLIASGQRGTFAGVGNIVARVETGGGNRGRNLVSYNGTVGHTLRKVQEMAFPWPAGALLIMHSDGLGTHWDLASYPGLMARHPALIAAVLYRDYDRGRDDVSVVVIRNRGTGS